MASKSKEDATTDLGRLQEQAFAAAYVAQIGRKSAAKAAESIGLAPAYGANLLARPAVKTMVQNLLQWQIEQVNANGLQVLMELWCVATSSVTEIGQFRSGEFVMRENDDIPQNATRAIKAVTFKKKPPKPDRNGFAAEGPDIEVKLEMHDKVGACRALLAHLGIDKRDPADTGGAEDKKMTWADVMAMAGKKPG